MFGIQGKGIEEDVSSHAVLQQALDVDQVVCDHGANTFTRGEHEVQDHDLILDQVVVEPYLSFLVVWSRGHPENSVPESPHEATFVPNSCSIPVPVQARTFHASLLLNGIGSANHV